MVTAFFRKIRHYFTPRESNNYRAKTLQNPAVIFYIALLIVLQFSMSTLKQFKPNILGYATDITSQKILSLVNQKRAEANLQPLSLSDQLSIAATQKAQDMFSKDYWAHVSPTGTTPWVFINNSGYKYAYAGENLARNFSTSDEVVEAWMNSPTHKANILKPEYNDIGLSIMNGKLNGEETTLVVEEFGTPAQPAVAELIPTVASEQPIAGSGKNLVGVKALGTNTIFTYLPTLNKTFSLLLAEFMLIVLFVDSIYLWRTKTPRFSSHSLAHIIFLGALIGAMGATGMGAIL